MAQTGAETLPGVPAETILTDRQILVHLLQHAEDLVSRLDVIETLFERYRPLLEQAESRAKRWGFITGSDRAAPGRAPRRGIGRTTL